jgi:DNA-binding NarL/FixJ family response regulator
MKILVCDDHALIREAMRGVLKDLVPDAAVIEASDARQLTEVIQATPELDLLLLDLNLPDQAGLAILADLRERHPAISVVVLSAFQDRDTVRRALDLGALGFIPKNTEREVVLGALRLVLAGGIYIPVQALNGAAPPAVANGASHPTDAGACAGDGRQEQQGDLPRPVAGRAHREEPHDGDLQGAPGHQPDRSGDRGRQACAGLARHPVTKSGGRRPPSLTTSERNVIGLTGLCSSV